MRSYTIGRVWDIPIRINASLLLFLPILVWLIGSGQQIHFYAGLIGDFAGTEIDAAALREVRWLVGLLAAVGLFVSVLLHELGHSWVARRYGIGIQSITLWIFGGVAALERVPREWNREFWIAIAGPITSVAVGLLFLAAARIVPPGLSIALFTLGWLGVINVVLAIFNLIPAFPMDGGRILRALLARNRPYASATRIAARIGAGFALVFALIGVLFLDVVLLLIALFIYAAATSESRYTTIADLLDGLTAGDLANRDPVAVPADATLAELTDRMFAVRRTALPVADDADELIGFVTLDQVKPVGATDRDVTTVREVMSESSARVDASDDAFDALIALNTARTDHALVEDADEVVGFLTTAEFSEALQFAAAAGKPAEPLEKGVV